VGISANAVGDASQRHLLARVTALALLLRHCTNLVVGMASVIDGSALRPTGRWVFAILGCWAVYRLATRSPRPALVVADFCLTVGVCLAIPELVSTPGFDEAFSAPLFVVWSAVTSFAGQYGAVLSVPMTATLTGAYAVGAAGIVGWARVPEIDAIHWFLLAGGSTVLIRLMLRRAAAEIDRARAVREEAEVRRNVSIARNNYDREQLAMLHDTAASTLLLVDQSTPVSPSLLAAQARRDLKLLKRHPWDSSSRQVDLVAALRSCAAHARTSVTFQGQPTVRVDGPTAQAVTAAVREALTNADRHAHGASITVTTRGQSVTVKDDGVGFVQDKTPAGRGITESIIGRLRRIGGTAHVWSAPGRGTLVTLSWKSPITAEAPPTSIHPDHLVERMWMGWGLALVGYAVVTVVVRARHSITDGPHPLADLALVAISAFSALSALPGILRGRWWPAWPAAVALLAVTVIQPTLAAGHLDSRTHWSHTAAGWCLVPLLLGLRFGIAATVQAAFWLVDTASCAVLGGSTQLIAILCLGAATNLVPEMAALMLNRLLGDAAAEAREEGERHFRLRTSELIAEAIRAEYQRCYADVIDGVVAVLTVLSRGQPVSPEMRLQSRAQFQCLRSFLEHPESGQHPLMCALRSMVDATQDRGADVEVHLDGELPELGEDEINRLVAPIDALLCQPVTSVRVALHASPDEVIASVVCEASAATVGLTPQVMAGEEGVDVVVSDGSVWLTVSLQLDGSVREYVGSQEQSA
jgi:hypothetical protein